MSVIINTSENTISVSEQKSNITLVDNNTGITVNVQPTKANVITVADQGPKGDAGATGAAGNVQGLVYTNLTSSGDISSSGNLTVSQSITFGAEEGDIIGSGKIRFRGGPTGQQDYLQVSNDVIKAYIDGFETITVSDSQINMNAGNRDVDFKVTYDNGIPGIATIADSNRLKLRDYVVIGSGSANINSGTDALTVSGSQYNIGNITASGHISISGDIFAEEGRFDNDIWIGPGQVGDNTSPRLRLHNPNTEHIYIDWEGGHLHYRYDTANKISFSPEGSISASGVVSASGNIYSNNIDSIPLSFQASGDGTNWYGPNKQGPYYYVYNFNYGNNTNVLTLAQEYAVAGIPIPYKATVLGFNAVVSHIGQSGTVEIKLFSGSHAAATFNQTSGAAVDLSLASLVSATSDTPGAPENPMIIKVTNGTNIVQEGNLIYPRVKTAGAGGAHVSMQILLRRIL